MMAEPGFTVFDAHGILDLRQIADSGQCFRLREYAPSKFVAVTGSHTVDIHQRENTYIFWCSASEFRSVWAPYFDLDTDYGAFQSQMQEDEFLCAAIAEGGGIRILRQDLWEMAVTFTISQRNNIPRIRKSVETLCESFGTPLAEIGWQRVYAFPTPQQLCGRDLSVASLGYREKYVKELASLGLDVWEQLQSQSDSQARKTLLEMCGIGEKVANCIMLFGLHRMDSYPRDVWVNRMVDDVYHGEFNPDKYAGFAGYVQQLQFYYYRKLQGKNR